MSQFSFIIDITGYFEFQAPKRLLNLTKISDPSVYFDASSFIRHLRVLYYYLIWLYYLEEGDLRDSDKN